MRFLLREQAYEKPIAAGRLRYEQAGEPTGAIEHWRMTHALDGHKFLRVDLDGRKSSGNSFLFTLLLNQQGRPENFRWRFFNKEMKARGQLLFHDELVTAVRSLERDRFEFERPFSAKTAFFFPAAVGLRLLKDIGSTDEVITLDMHAQENDFMKLSALEMNISQNDTLKVAWADQTRELWLNADGWPERMERQDGLTAVAERFLNYE